MSQLNLESPTSPRRPLIPSPLVLCTWKLVARPLGRIAPLLPCILGNIHIITFVLIGPSHLDLDRPGVSIRSRLAAEGKWTNSRSPPSSLDLLLRTAHAWSLSSHYFTPPLHALPPPPYFALLSLSSFPSPRLSVLVIKNHQHHIISGHVQNTAPEWRRLIRGLLCDFRYPTISIEPFLKILSSDNDRDTTCWVSQLCQGRQPPNWEYPSN